METHSLEDTIKRIGYSPSDSRVPISMSVAEL